MAPRPLFRPKTNHTCHQKPNPFRETVPLRWGRKEEAAAAYRAALAIDPSILSARKNLKSLGEGKS